jgi:hypothetical protein
MRRLFVAGMVVVSAQAFVVAPPFSSTLPRRSRGVTSLDVGKRPKVSLVDFNLRDADDQIRAQAYAQKVARAAQEERDAEEQRFQSLRSHFFEKRTPLSWRLMDGNSDGTVDFTKFAAAFGNKLTGVAKNLNLIDTVGKKIFGDLPSEVSVLCLRRLFDELNTARNGRLNRDEFLFGSKTEYRNDETLTKGETPSVLNNQESICGKTSFGVMMASLVQTREGCDQVKRELHEIENMSRIVITKLQDMQNQSPNAEEEISKLRHDLEVKLQDLRRASLWQLEMIDTKFEKTFSKGSLSLVAWNEAFGVSAMSEAIFDYLDVNKDGKVSWEEFSKAMSHQD